MALLYLVYTDSIKGTHNLMVGFIQAHAADSVVMLVGTHLDCLQADGPEIVRKLEAEVQSMYPPAAGYPKICAVCPVSCVTGKGVDILKETIYHLALDMEMKESLWMKHQRVKVIGRQASHL